MKKSFVLGLLLIGLSIFGATAARAQTQTIFIAQAAAGGNTGADCADALVYTFFNSAGNWASSFTAGKISPGTTVEICGTITASAISTRLLSFQGPGTSGNPITLLFGPGASLQSPAFGSGDNTLGAILDSQSWTVIDGGGTGSVWNNGGSSTFVPNGSIQNTANGSALANQQDSVAIWLSGSNITVQNMSIFNIYQHTSATDSGPAGAADWAIGCRPCTSTDVIQNCVFHDIMTGIYEGFNTDSGNVFQDLEIYNVNHGIEVGNNGTGFTATGNLITHNKIHDYANWDAPSGGGTGAFHHDGILAYAFGTGSSVTNFQVIANIFYGNYGNTATAHLFLEQLVSTTVVNNLFIDPGTCVQNMSVPAPCGVQFIEGAATSTNNMYNNTIVGPSDPPSDGASVQETTVPAWNFEDNVIVSTNIALNLVNGSNTVTMTAFDFNVYGQFTGSSFAQSHACAGNVCSTFAVWQAAISPFETHSTFTNSNLNLNSNGSPGTGSAARNAGTNLTSLCGSIPALCTDIFGNARPVTGPWDAGAIQVSGSAGSVTIAPAFYNFVTTMVGSSSSDSPVTFTLTNNTGVTVTGVAISFTGANAGDFSKTTSCGTTLASSASCQIFVTFTPTAAGSRTATLSVSDSDASSPQTSSLSGTAISSVINSSPANPVTFGVVVTDPSIPSTVKNEKHSKDLPVDNFDHVALVGFLHQDRARNAASASASQ